MIFALFAGDAGAACQEPAMAVPVEQRQKIEGEVQAGVALVRGGASGAKEESVAWQANLPSQSVLDAQWTLYLLCVEYEAGRLPKDAYCEAQAGVWEKISGRTIPIDGCLSSEDEAATTGGATSSAIVPGAPTAAAPPTVITAAPVPQVSPSLAPAPRAVESTTTAGRGPVLVGAPPAPAGLVGEPSVPVVSSTVPTSPTHHAVSRSQRWLSTDEKYRGLEIFGPIDLNPDEDPIWVATNGLCLSLLGGPPTDMVEDMLVDRRQCSAWTSVAIAVDGPNMQLTADGTTFKLHAVSAPADAVTQGVWRAEFYARIPPKVRPLTVEFTDGDAAALWSLTGCSSTWKLSEKSQGEAQYIESAHQLRCMTGATVEVFVLAEDTLLLSWTNLGLELFGLARR